MDWAQAPEPRDQLVLFAEKLDDAIGKHDPVRLLDTLLDGIDWSVWEAEYKLTRGMPPIHPRVLAGLLIYGLLMRVRTSRVLERALEVRLDFRWLVEGRSIDHSTISKFRKSHAKGLCDLFVQIGLIAQQMGYLELITLGYDGTRIRANNRNSGTRTPEELREAKKQLALEFEEHRKAIEQAQTEEDEAFVAEVEEKTQGLEFQSAKVDAALAEIDRIQAEGKQVPARIPITDPHCRISQNKDGGFGANYNPTVTVDIDSGLIVDANVIPGIDEQSHMIDSVNRARENFGDASSDDDSQEKQPVTVLADGLMATASNVVGCEEENIEFISPAGSENVAYRDDLSQPVPDDKIAELPRRGKKPKSGEDIRKFDKSAFIYDAELDVYWCPKGKQLKPCGDTTDHRGDPRLYYGANPDDCAACALQPDCFKQSRGRRRRRIECGVHEKAKQAHAAKLQKPESKQKYDRRAAATERPFAVIKQFFGVRAFLTRGLDCVRNEWNWLAIAHNIHKLMNLGCLAQIRSNAP